jgi:hypothetical protein
MTIARRLLAPLREGIWRQMAKPFQQFEYGRKENIIKVWIFEDFHSHMPFARRKANRCLFT